MMTMENFQSYCAAYYSWTLAFAAKQLSISKVLASEMSSIKYLLSNLFNLSNYIAENHEYS